jgi:hypothetical protein
MKIKQLNKEKINQTWISWKYDIFWANRMQYKTDMGGNYYGKEFIQDQAMLKLITKMIRKYA